MSTNIYTGVCYKCQKKFTKEIKWYHIPKYCCRSCANSHKHSKDTKRKISKTLRKSSKNYTKIYFCPIIGLYYHNKKEYEKRTWSIYPTGRYRTIKLIAKIFNIELGQPKAADQLSFAVNTLKKAYEDDLLSGAAIKEKFNIPCSISHTINFLKSLGIKRRSLSDAGILALETGRRTTLPLSPPPFNRGWHIAWDNSEHYYRSSYELDYYRILDLKKVHYKTENLRIRYFDTQRNKERVAIPDIVVNSTIYEIKSNYTFDVINMKDKQKAYNIKGYGLILILEKQEYILNSLNELIPR